jgi:hypothetical protein
MAPAVRIDALRTRVQLTTGRRIVEHDDHAFIAVDGDVRDAVTEAFHRAVDVEHGGDAELASDDRGVRERSALLHDDGPGTQEDRRPRRVGGTRHDDVTRFDVGTDR